MEMVWVKGAVAAYPPLAKTETSPSIVGAVSGGSVVATSFPVYFEFGYKGKEPVVFTACGFIRAVAVRGNRVEVLTTEGKEVSEVLDEEPPEVVDIGNVVAVAEPVCLHTTLINALKLDPVELAIEEGKMVFKYKSGVSGKLEIEANTNVEEVVKVKLDCCTVEGMVNAIRTLAGMTFLFGDKGIGIVEEGEKRLQYYFRALDVEIE